MDGAPTLKDMMELRNNKEAYIFYVEKYLVAVVGSKKDNEFNTKLVSDVATVTDEAYGLFLLANSWNRWEDMRQLKNWGRKGENCSSIKPAYTQSASRGGTRTFGGWTKLGVEFFNVMVKKIKADHRNNSDWDEEYLRMRLHQGGATGGDEEASMEETQELVYNGLMDMCSIGQEESV